MSYISEIETAVPDYCHTQEAITSFYQQLSNDEATKRKIKKVAQGAAIDTRYSVINDFSEHSSERTFFNTKDIVSKMPTLSERMSLFQSEALKLSLKAILKIKDIEKIKSKITHIITVTCTGLFAPGLEVDLVKELKLNPAIQRSSVNFMGCNAAIIAFNQANAICNSIPHSKVLIVCTELCTIHFQNEFSDDYIRSTALFGDGAAAVIVDSEKKNPEETRNIKISSFNSMLITSGYKEMSWQITEKGFVMNLSSYVSDLINGEMKHLLELIGLKKEQTDYWAVHPGGKKILDDFAKTVGLEKEKLKESYDVLRSFGNMSSATILFVLRDVIVNSKKLEGETLFCAAFGPGLSVETMQLAYV